MDQHADREGLSGARPGRPPAGVLGGRTSGTGPFGNQMELFENMIVGRGGFKFCEAKESPRSDLVPQRGGHVQRGVLAQVTSRGRCVEPLGRVRQGENREQLSLSLYSFVLLTRGFLHSP